MTSQQLKAEAQEAQRQAKEAAYLAYSTKFAVSNYLKAAAAQENARQLSAKYIESIRFA